VSAWLVILVAGVASYALRMSMIFVDRLRLPARLEVTTELVAPAAFTALATSSLAAALFPFTVVAATPVAIATAVAVTLAVSTARPYLSLLGLPAYWLTAALLG
jgi:branched-subunit amino acid transport protein